MMFAANVIALISICLFLHVTFLTTLAAQGKHLLLPLAYLPTAALYT